MKTYKKRALSGWCTKYDKKQSNRTERQYGRREAWNALNKPDNSSRSYHHPTYTYYPDAPSLHKSQREWWEGI